MFVQPHLFSLIVVVVLIMLMIMLRGVASLGNINTLVSSVLIYFLLNIFKNFLYPFLSILPSFNSESSMLVYSSKVLALFPAFRLPSITCNRLNLSSASGAITITFTLVMPSPDFEAVASRLRVGATGTGSLDLVACFKFLFSFKFLCW